MIVIPASGSTTIPVREEAALEEKASIANRAAFLRRDEVDLVPPSLAREAVPDLLREIGLEGTTTVAVVDRAGPDHLVALPGEVGERVELKQHVVEGDPGADLRKVDPRHRDLLP